MTTKDNVVFDPRTGEILKVEQDVVMTEEDAAVHDLAQQVTRTAMNITENTADLISLRAVIEADIANRYPQLAVMEETVREDTERYKMLEAQLKEAAQKAAMVTPTRKSWFGIVRISATVTEVYDPKKALAWCQENYQAGVRTKVELDANAFKEYAAGRTMPEDVYRREDTLTPSILSAGFMEFLSTLK